MYPSETFIFNDFSDIARSNILDVFVRSQESPGGDSKEPIGARHGTFLDVETP